ncbi:tetratricopeptide repeat protein [Kitasatospora sp. NPDC057015]|uniref:tetratricopeptide repeat protein n=1 Tax=Kitasatospora sp. NPDC057015 TaxID=3346001 RepID=UPI0036287EED
MEQQRLAAVTGTGGPGSGYAVGGRLVLTSAHVTGPAGSRVTVFHPAGGGTAGGTVVWAGTPRERDDAALVLVDDSPHWRPPAAPVRWGRLVTTRPGAVCETWGVPDEAQRPRLAVEAEQLAGRINPGTGFVNSQYVMDLDQHPPHWPAEGTSPWGGLSGAAVYCGTVVTGVVAADRARSAHGRLNVVPAYVLLHDPAFRTALARYCDGPVEGLEAVEFQHLTDPAHGPAALRPPATPAALLEAGRQVVPFHGREDLLAELRAWCALGGFGAWLLHGPGGQGKTRLAHHLGRRLTADGWTVLWPRAAATPEQLRPLRSAARSLLVVLDYAETRTHQLTALVEAAAEHPGTSAFKLLLLARTAGDWWEQARIATRLAEDHLTTARTHRLAPLEDDPDRRAGHYRDAARALAAELPLVDGLTGHEWAAAAAALPSPQGLAQDAYGNALTLHMTALADLLDTTRSEPAHRTKAAQDVEDRLLGHESRYWLSSATVRGISPGLSMDTLKTALAAAHLTGADDREHADVLWQHVPALTDQPRDRRDQVTAWLAALYPTTVIDPDGQPWGALQPDRLAERHIGRTLEADPRLADHLVDGADDTRTGRLLTVYSRAAAHTVFQNRLDNRLTELCVRHHRLLTPLIISTATRTNHPQPLIDALDAIAAEPAVRLDDLYNLLPSTSHRLAPTATRLAQRLVQHHRTLAETDPDAHLANLATALNNLSLRLGETGRWDEGLAAVQEALAIRRTLAEADPDAHLTGLATALNVLSLRLGETGRWEEGLAAVQEATDHFRVLAQADPGAHLPRLASALNNLSLGLNEVGRRKEGVAAAQEAAGRLRALAEADPDAHLPNLALALNNLSVQLGEVGRREEGLAAVQEATDLRALAEANPDAHLPNLAQALDTLSNQLGDAGRREESLAAALEATDHFRALAEANPDAHLPNLAMALDTLSNQLGDAGRREESLTAIEEAVVIRRALAQSNPVLFEADLRQSLEVLARLEGLEQPARDALAEHVSDEDS